jgi:hypothetical protein
MFCFGIEPKSNMSSRTLLAQDDFSCLKLAAGQDVEPRPLDGYDGFTSIESAGSGDSLKSVPACESNEIYRPVNFIPDEVYELIRNWEVAYLKQQESIQAIDLMDTDMSGDSRPSENIFEPTRLMPVSEAPPKRFYRTFWRSVTRRIIQLERENYPKKADMSRFFASDCADKSNSSD